MEKKILILIFVINFIALLPLFGNTELIGQLTKQQILESFPDWQEQMSSYLPKAEFIEKLHSINWPVKIDVFLGTWCPDSKEHVSDYFKIIGMADNPNILTNYIGIPRDKGSRQPFIEGKDIERIPTFIIYINNKEKGRIVEHPKTSVEEDLADIILKAVL